jgi:hypothetical protein
VCRRSWDRIRRTSALGQNFQPCFGQWRMDASGESSECLQPFFAADVDVLPDDPCTSERPLKEAMKGQIVAEHAPLSVREDEP